MPFRHCHHPRNVSHGLGMSRELAIGGTSDVRSGAVDRPEPCLKWLGSLRVRTFHVLGLTEDVPTLDVGPSEPGGAAGAALGSSEGHKWETAQTLGGPSSASAAASSRGSRPSDRRGPINTGRRRWRRKFTFTGMIAPMTPVIWSPLTSRNPEE